MLNLYLISAKNTTWDQYNSAVVCARDEASARTIHPNGKRRNRGTETWVPPEHVRTRYIGKAAGDLKEGQVICASFNAG